MDLPESKNDGMSDYMNPLKAGMKVLDARGEEKGSQYLLENDIPTIIEYRSQQMEKECTVSEKKYDSISLNGIAHIDSLVKEFNKNKNELNVMIAYQSLITSVINIANTTHIELQLPGLEMKKEDSIQILRTSRVTSE